MRIPPLPKRWLIHEIKYEEYTGKRDSYGNYIYADPVVIKHVRFDDETVFSRDMTDTKIIANAVIFVDSTHSTNLPEKFVEQSKITFRDDVFTLKKVIEAYHPTKNKVRHYELEVV